MRNSEYFEREIGWIGDPVLQAFAIKYTDLFPEYFGEKPASSSGKYHAAWSNSAGGLRKHTKAVMYEAHELADAYCLTDIEHDAALVAALGHDAVKYGIQGGRHTTHSHAAEGALFFARVVKALNYTDLPLFDRIHLAIAEHMGRWGDYQTKRVFPEDFPKLSQLVHVADMAASRREAWFLFLEEGALIG